MIHSSTRFLGLLLIAYGFLHPASALDAGPNVLFIIADDQHRDEFGFL